jgi:hypothetical protein
VVGLHKKEPRAGYALGVHYAVNLNYPGSGGVSGEWMPPGRNASKQAPDAKTSPHSVAYPRREVAGPKQPSHLAPSSAEPPARPSFGIRVSAALKIRLPLIRVPSSGRRAERRLGEIRPELFRPSPLKASTKTSRSGRRRIVVDSLTIVATGVVTAFAGRHQPNAIPTLSGEQLVTIPRASFR